jgi:hypothetical protein
MSIPSNDERAQFYAAMFPLLSKISMGRIIAGLACASDAASDASKAMTDFAHEWGVVSSEIAARMRGKPQ